MKTPNYHDFYQKALIPIGLNDLLTLNELESYDIDSPFTHWLIAIEGEQLPQRNIYYHWKVNIYPSNLEGDMNWKKPFYCSPRVESMDRAHEMACSFTSLSKHDQLSTLKAQEKIS